jgi:GTPase SAR1 family protein
MSSRSTMVTSAFEIRIALIGHVSAGKTTVMNALFREKYGEVSMGRTTAGINYFRISAKTNLEALVTGEDEGLEGKESTDANPSRAESKEGMKWSAVEDRENRTAKSTLAEIAADNAKLRELDEIQEKFFDIELDEVFCDMRKDTALVLVDVPGINEAGSGSKYKKFVDDKWNTFDCVVLIMDARQGVNTEEQVALLEFTKRNLKEKKDVPVLILSNKVDDPDDEEQGALVQEARQEVERVFEVSDRKDALASLLGAARAKTKSSCKDLYPAFIPISAIHAFIYRTASLMSLEQFKLFDKDLIEKLGREEVGKWKWAKLGEDERYAVAHAAVIDQTTYAERLAATNFDKVLTALSRAVGDGSNQLKLIQKQLTVSLKSVSSERGLSRQLKSIYVKATLAGVQENFQLYTFFWSNYQDLEDKAFGQLNGPTDVACLANPMDELQEYYKMCSQHHWKDEQSMSIFRMKALVRRQFCVLLTEERRSRTIEWKHTLAFPQMGWNSLSPEDWKTICRSVLLVSCYKSFCLTFGQEKIWIESVIDKINRTSRSCSCKFPNGSDSYTCCSSCGCQVTRNWCRYCGSFAVSATYFYCDNCGDPGSNDDEELNCCSAPQVTSTTCVCGYSDAVLGFTMKDGELASIERVGKMHRFKSPDSVSNPGHWGHLMWMFCQFVEATGALGLTMIGQ